MLKTNADAVEKNNRKNQRYQTRQKKSTTTTTTTTNNHDGLLPVLKTLLLHYLTPQRGRLIDYWLFHCFWLWFTLQPVHLFIIKQIAVTFIINHQRCRPSYIVLINCLDRSCRRFMPLFSLRFVPASTTTTTASKTTTTTTTFMLFLLFVYSIIP